jgi:hypothetical protein
MAIALDQPLGQNLATTGTTVTVTTTATAAAGSKIFAYFSWWNSGSATLTVAGGGLTWSSRVQVNGGGGDRYAIWSADAPAGLASGSTITARPGPAAAGSSSTVVSYTGLATGTAADATNTATGTGASWSSGSATNLSADALFIGGSGNETTSTTSTPTAGTEITGSDQYSLTAQQGAVAGYTIAATVASQAITGTWVGGRRRRTPARSSCSPLPVAPRRSSRTCRTGCRSVSERGTL